MTPELEKGCEVGMLRPPEAQFQRNDSVPFYRVSFISFPVVFLSSYVKKERCIPTLLIGKVNTMHCTLITGILPRVYPVSCNSPAALKALFTNELM